MSEKEVMWLGEETSRETCWEGLRSVVQEMRWVDG